MKKLIFILALLPMLVSAQKTLDSLIGCYAGTFMYREDPDTVWTTVRPDTLIVFDTDTVYVNPYGEVYNMDAVSWLLVNPNTINPTTSYTYLEDSPFFCTLGLGFDECNFSSIEEIRQAICNDIMMLLVFADNDSIHYLVECFQPGQFEAMRYAWFKGVRYTSEIPDSLQNVSVPDIEKNKIIADIYPNPVKEFLNIDLNNKEKVTITINDITGKQIYKNNFYSQNIKVSFKPYKKGIYFVNIKNKNAMITKKIVY